MNALGKNAETLVGVVDQNFRSRREALDEMRRRHAIHGGDTIVKMEECRYRSGFRVRSVPVEFIVEPLIESGSSAPERWTSWKIMKRRK